MMVTRWLWGLAVGLLTALIYGIYASATGVTRPRLFVDAAICGLLASCVQLLTAELARRRIRRCLRTMVDDVISQRTRPSPGTLTSFRLGIEPTLSAVYAAIDMLVACYRQALQEVVELQERLDHVDSEKSPAPPVPRFVIGSSRHRMVAKLAPNLHWMAATPPLLAFLGCPLSRISGRSCLDVVHPDDAPRLRRTLKEALRDGEGHDITFRLRPPMADRPPAKRPASSDTQTEYVVRMDVMTWYGEGGVATHLRCHWMDITEKVRTEQELRRLQVDLRTRNDELARANEQLRRINQELKDFTYVVSHDLKEPLRTVEAFSTFLAKDYSKALSGEGLEYLNHLTQASKRLGDLIEDLLALSRAGRVMNTPRAFAWDDVLATVRGDLGQRLHLPHNSFRVEGPLPEVVGDQNRVMQLLTNLISNGLKYNRTAQREVVFGAGPGDSNDFAAFFVRDNGIGIEAQYYEQIFQMFKRLHSREEFEGTGAGLAICRRVVEAHGGRIWVESQPGKGTTFWFTLPRLQGPGPLPPRPDRVLPALDTGPSSPARING
jgi:signal transduction histidine kinase